jgi:hypothetical protein
MAANETWRSVPPCMKAGEELGGRARQGGFGSVSDCEGGSVVPGCTSSMFPYLHLTVPSYFRRTKHSPALAAPRTGVFYHVARTP